MGFSYRHHAKTSLLNSCKKDVDFYLTDNREITDKIEDKRADFEIIRQGVKTDLAFTLLRCLIPQLEIKGNLVQL